MTHSPRASVWICVALTPSAVVKSKASRVVEIVLVGPMRIARLTGQGFERARDARQFQRPRVREDEIARDFLRCSVRLTRDREARRPHLKQRQRLIRATIVFRGRTGLRERARYGRVESDM